MKLKTTLAAALVLGSFATSANTPAEAAIKTLGQCYTAVTNACNKKKSDQAVAACNENGHSQCDKQFGSSKMEIGPVDGLRAGNSMISGG